MNINATTEHLKNIKSFENLLQRGIPPEDLQKELLELFANYSRMLIKYYEEGATGGVCPLGDPDTQLFTLMQVIAVASAHTDKPLFSELIYFGPSVEENASDAA